MRFLVISDIHGAADRVRQLADCQLGADYLLCAGDLTNFGDAGAVRRMVAALKGLAPRAAAVAGNCDPPGGAEILREEGVGLEGRIAEEAGMELAGIGGALPGPAPTPNEIGEEDVRERLAGIDGAGLPLVLVSHQPPFQTVADRAMRVKPVGSRVLRDWMEGVGRPWLLVTGHIHESAGARRYGATWVVNPGPLAKGRYAVIEADSPGEELRIQLERLGGPGKEPRS